MSEESPEPWTRVSKGRKAVTHTAEQANKTPVQNQFQDLSEQEQKETTTPTPKLAPRELIKAFALLSPEESPPDSNNPADNNDSDKAPSDSNNPADNNDTESIGSIDSTNSIDSFTMTSTTEKPLLDIITQKNADQATVFNGSKHTFADVVLFRRILGTALATCPCALPKTKDTPGSLTQRKTTPKEWGHQHLTPKTLCQQHQHDPLNH